MRITDEQVRELRERHAAGEYDRAALAADYGLTEGYVCALLRGHRRLEAGGPIAEPRTPRLSDEQVQRIRERFASGAPAKKLASEYKTSTAYVLDLCRGRSRIAAGGPITEADDGIRKLEDEQVRQLRERYASGEDIRAMADEYGVSVSYARALVHGVWRLNAGGPVTTERPPSKRLYAHFKSRGTKNGNAKLDEDKVREIRQLRAEGEGMPTLAKRFGVSYNTIAMVVGRQSWAHVK